MKSFDVYYKFDLEYLEWLVFDTIRGMHYACDELKEECLVCGDVMKNQGNQAAWSHIDTISMKMMETSKMIARRADGLHKLLEERNQYIDGLENEKREEMEKLLRWFEEYKR